MAIVEDRATLGWKHIPAGEAKLLVWYYRTRQENVEVIVLNPGALGGG